MIAVLYCVYTQTGRGTLNEKIIVLYVQFVSALKAWLSYMQYPLAFVDLVLNGDAEAYLKSVAEYNFGDYII